MTEEISEEPAEKVQTERAKNFFALIIILGGLFLGSLFVDFIQLVNGEGFSSWAAKNYNVLETAGKTWVGYSDPKVELTIITDKDCPECDPSEALVWLRRVVPTLETTRIDISDELGSVYTERFGIVTLPAFVFSKDITATNFYSQAASLFQGKDGRYFFDMSKIGLPAGRYLKLPQVESGDIIMGSEAAKVTIVEYSDFECPYCQTFHKQLKETVALYGDQVRLVFKHLPLSIHVQAENAALASECAHEQGEFESYSDYLFAKQAEWSKSKGTQKFKDYAWWLKLDGRTFATCLESKKYQENIVADKTEAARLLVTATPGTFVNGTFLDGAVTTADLKATIEAELAK